MDRFVVGSGRCGSTLLSRMLALHRDVVSLFEVFNGLDGARRFDPTPVSGAAIGELLGAEQPFVTAVLRRGYPVAEIVYPFGPEARQRPGDPLPWLLVATLPRLTDDPDTLFDALMEFVRGRAPSPPADHYRAVFDWLTRECGGRLWVERSGSSVDYLEGLHTSFPDARFVHLHRDGREVALSMREHHAYRLPISILYQAPLDTGETLADLGPLDLASDPSVEDPISRILASTPPAEAFGRYWTDQIVRGTSALAALPSEQRLDLRFEDLLQDPGEALQRIAAFFALDEDPDFLPRACQLVCGIPPARFPKLSAEEQARLVEACAPGQARLGR
jgi:hypothetical protein